MTEASRRLLNVVVCSAGPAGQVGRLVDLAQQREWEVQIIATPPALDFIDSKKLEKQTGNPIRSVYRQPGEPRSRLADAIAVAPATYNTVNKLALGISDTYALGVLAEGIGRGIPVVILPFVNSALASRQPFQDSVEQLRGENVTVLLGPGQFEPHPPGTGAEQEATYPWELVVERVERLLHMQHQ